MVHTTDTKAALTWYLAAFAQSKLVRLPEFNFEYLDVNGIYIEIVPADEKVAAGAAGTVVYWEVDNFQLSFEHLISIGAILYRGPMKIENNRQMCQLKDPFGNLIGIRG